MNFQMLFLVINSLREKESFCLNSSAIFSHFMQPSKCFILFIASQLVIVQLAHMELIPSLLAKS